MENRQQWREHKDFKGNFIGSDFVFYHKDTPLGTISESGYKKLKDELLTLTYRYKEGEDWQKCQIEVHGIENIQGAIDEAKHEIIRLYQIEKGSIATPLFTDSES